MTDYPSSVYAPRTKSNIAGVAYDPAKANIGFAEDITYLENEVLAIIADLVGAGSANGLKGAAASFKTNWLAEHTAAGAHTADVISEKTPGAGVTVDGVACKDSGIYAADYVSWQSAGINLSNGANDDVDTSGVFGFTSISGPTAAAGITGIVAPTQGRCIMFLTYNGGQNITLYNNNAGSAETNRILTMTNADLTSTGAFNAILLYAASHWRVFSWMS